MKKLVLCLMFVNLFLLTITAQQPYKHHLGLRLHPDSLVAIRGDYQRFFGQSACSWLVSLGAAKHAVAFEGMLLYYNNNLPYLFATKRELSTNNKGIYWIMGSVIGASVAIDNKRSYGSQYIGVCLGQEVVFSGKLKGLTLLLLYQPAYTRLKNLFGEDRFEMDYSKVSMGIRAIIGCTQ